MILILHDPQIQKLIANMVIKNRLEDHENNFMDYGRPFERKYRVKMREVFDQQLDDIMASLQAFKSVKDIYYTDVKLRIKAGGFITMTFNYEDVSHPPLHCS